MELGRAPRVGVGRTAEIYAWGEGRVLKLYHDWVPEHWVASERRGTEAAHEAGLPAPAVLGTEQVDGRRGIVLERVDGPSLLQILARKPWRAPWVARTLAELHASMHAPRRCPPGMPRLRSFLREGIRGSGLGGDVQRRAETALDGLPDGEALCHYDLHPDNVLLTRRGPVVIDWMAAAVGHPLADVARTLLLMRIGGGPGPVEARLRAFLAGLYLRRYLRLTGASRDALRGWELPVGAARASEKIEVERWALQAWLARVAG